MSSWSHITALVMVEAGGYNLPFHDMVRNVLHYAPKIYGSEGDARVKVIDWGMDTDCEGGYIGGSYYSSDPCEVCPSVRHCRYSRVGNCCSREIRTLKKMQEMKAQGEEYNGFNDMVAFTRHCMVYIHGNLRDTTPEQTREEFKKFVEYIRNSFPRTGKPLTAKVIFKRIS